MPTLSELISRCIVPEAKGRNEAKIAPLSAPIQPKSEKPHDKYEAEVFNYLLDSKEALGISRIMKFTALTVDGAIELLDGKPLTLEIKFRMNWAKACQAEWQFRHWLKRSEAKDYPVSGGLVFFEEFSGDWNRRARCRFLENGWNHWYRGHSEVDGFRLDLLRLCMGKVESFPLAHSIIAEMEKLTGEETARVKLRLLEERYEQNKREQGGDEHVRELSMRSLKRLINQLKEEIARFESHSSLRTDGE
jgi:hypothetical protein